jgi:hypothetical protein
MARKRWRRERWISVIEEYERSGMTQREFARSRRLKLPTLQSWIYKLRREGDGEDPPLRFVELTGEAVASSGVTVVAPGGLELVFHELPPPAYLVSLLRHLSDPRGC